MTTPLPLWLDPAPEETWQSYLTRRAAQHQCTVSELADAIGLRRRQQWPPYHGVAIQPGLRDAVARPLGMAPADVDALHMARYDQLAFDLTGLLDQPGINTTRAVTARHWTWLAGSTYCPECLAEDGIWRQAWRLPWITACPTHRLALAGRCPECGSVPGLGGTLHASAPHRVDTAPDGRLCTHPHGTDVCGADLTSAARRPAGLHRLARARLMTSIVTTGRGTVLGTQRTSLQALTAWQSAIGLAMHLGLVHAAGWGRNNRQLNPPRDPDLLDRLLAAAEPVVSAQDPDQGADVLQSWCTRAGIRTPHRGTFTRTTRPSAALQPAFDALLARHGRAHTRLQRALTTRDGTPLVPAGYTAASIPQLAWPCALPPHRRDSTTPDQRILRAVLAMILVRALDPGDWTSAGATLGLPADKARNWTRYAFSSRFPGLREELVEAGARCRDALTKDRSPALWARRPPIQGYGVLSLAQAQQPGCALGEPAGWCPCAPQQP